jgi:diaminopimelate decarboxylase
MRKLLLATIALCVVAAAMPIHGIARAPGTLHDGLELARTDHAADPEAVAAFERLAREFGTPLYVYDRATILSQFARVRDAFRASFPKLRVFFAVKANSNPAIVSLLHTAGAGAEVVSGGEIVLSRRAGGRRPGLLFTRA